MKSQFNLFIAFIIVFASYGLLVLKQKKMPPKSLKERDVFLLLRLLFLTFSFVLAICLFCKFPDIKYLSKKNYIIYDENKNVYFVDKFSINNDNSLNFLAEKRMLKIQKIKIPELETNVEIFNRKEEIKNINDVVEIKNLKVKEIYNRATKSKISLKYHTPNFLETKKIKYENN